MPSRTVIIVDIRSLRAKEQDMEPNLLAVRLEQNCLALQCEINRTYALRMKVELSIRELRGLIAESKLLCLPPLTEMDKHLPMAVHA